MLRRKVILRRYGASLYNSSKSAAQPTRGQILDSRRQRGHIIHSERRTEYVRGRRSPRRTCCTHSSDSVAGSPPYCKFFFRRGRRQTQPLITATKQDACDLYRWKVRFKSSKFENMQQCVYCCRCVENTYTQQTAHAHPEAPCCKNASGPGSRRFFLVEPNPTPTASGWALSPSAGVCCWLVVALRKPPGKTKCGLMSRCVGVGGGWSPSSGRNP